jgi:hypothetical protein
MKVKRLIVILLAFLSLGLVSCYRRVGYHFYPGVPRFAPTYPGDVELLRNEPRRNHIQLGEIWIKPDPRMSRYYVEGRLREEAARMGADALVIVEDRYFGDRVVARSYWRGRVAYRERLIVGVAVRYRR